MPEVQLSAEESTGNPEGGMIVPKHAQELVMAEIVDHLGQDIRARRRELSLGQVELADLSGTSVRFIRSLEQGKATVRLDRLIAVLDKLGLELRAARFE